MGIIVLVVLLVYMEVPYDNIKEVVCTSKQQTGQAESSAVEVSSQMPP
jgi:hypothetical protein